MTDDWQPTACILCECNCGIVVQVEDRKLARIRGDKEHPGTQGYTCNKALRLDHDMEELVDVQSSHYIVTNPHNCCRDLFEYRLRIQTSGGYTTLSFSLPKPNRM